MIHTDCNHVVAAPRSEVYALLIDPIRLDELAGIAGAVLSDEELGNGQRVLRSEAALPNRATVHTQTVLVELVKDERVVFHSTSGPTLAGVAPWLRFGRIDIERVLTLSEQTDGTLVRDESRWRYRPILLHLFFAFVNRGALRRASERSLERLSDCVLAARG